MKDSVKKMNKHTRHFYKVLHVHVCNQILEAKITYLFKVVLGGVYIISYRQV